MVFTYGTSQIRSIINNAQTLSHKWRVVYEYLVVESDVHEEAVHVSPEQSRADQMGHTWNETMTMIFMIPFYSMLNNYVDYTHTENNWSFLLCKC